MDFAKAVLEIGQFWLWRHYLSFGSKADVARDQLNVRFTPKSGHRNGFVGTCDHLEFPRGISRSG